MTACLRFQARLTLNIAELVPSTNIFSIYLVIINLKHLVRISGKGNGLSLSFSSDLMQQTILFDEQSDTLTITAIPKSLKKQIMEHLNSAKKDNS